MEFEERLVYLRNNRDLSQYEMAAKLYVDRSRYCKWEQGKSRPSYEMLAQIADFFGVTTDYLLGRTDRPELHVIDNPQEFAALGAEQLSRSGDTPYTPDQIAAITDAVLQEMEKRTK